MKSRFLLSLLFISISIFSFAQTESLNQLDANGKKDGKWTVYLDAYWNITDSVHAAYSRYTWFDHGTNIQPMGAGGNKNFKLESTSTSAGKIKLLDGEYKWYDEKGKLKYIHVFKNGEYVSFKEFYPSGQALSFFDYSKQYEGQPHSWYMYTYDKGGKVKYEGYMKKNEQGKWPMMRD